MTEFEPNLQSNKKYHHEEKILLALMPFWDPLIPPQAIGRLARFLRKYDYNITAIDANIEERFKELYLRYFDRIKEVVPGNKQGNFINIGNEVLRDHMMAHQNYEDEEEYKKLVKLIIYKTFYCDIDDDVYDYLDRIVTTIYQEMEDYCLEWLETVKPTVLGITVYRDTLPLSLFVFKLAKEKYPHIRTIMGGSIFTILLTRDSPNLDYFLERTQPYLDKIIRGPGELLFLKYLRGELPEDQRIFTPKDIGGKNLALSEIEVPDFSDFDVQQYPYLASFTAASCPFNCSFCNIKDFWGEYKMRDVRITVKEMVELYKQYKNQLFFLLDGMVNSFASDLSNALIEADESLYWDAYLKVDDSVANIENTLLWRRGGLYRVRLGTETGSQRLLDIIKKNITPEQIKNSLASLAHAGIKTTAYWLIGHPGETEEDFQQTLDLIEETSNNIWEIECNAFMYYYSGQHNSNEWAKKRVLLYPENAKEMLICQTWILDMEPSRETLFKRINRFVQHCLKLGIPTIHSLHDTYKADQRWKRLHKNAVPPLLDFKKGAYVDECRNVKTIFLAKNAVQQQGDFGF